MKQAAPVFDCSRRDAVAYDPWLFRYAVVWAVATLLLLVAGGLVTSHGAGLSVPDWPTTYGENPFTFPYSRWVGNIFYEHGHRLIASGVGLLTIGMAVMLTWRERRTWVRRLGWAALGAVVLQGALGGLTVLLLLPPSVSVAHAGLAQLFFCTAVSVTLFLSRGWRAAVPTLPHDRGAALRRWWIATTTVIYAQVLLGAVMRHTEAGLAITDFPLAYGRLVPPTDAAAIDAINTHRRLGELDLPPITAQQILIHYVHRLNALLVAAMVVAASILTIRGCRGQAWLTRPAMLIVGLLLMQIVLGAWTVLSLRAVAVNTAHVVVGASLLATSLVLALRVHRATAWAAATDELSAARLEGAAA